MHSAAAPAIKAHRACGACGATGSTVCHEQRFVVPEGYPLPSGYKVLACRRCGFVYADPAASQRDYDRFYSEWSKYDDSVTATGSGVSPYDATRLAETATDIARALPSKAATILDAGCATGGLLTALRDQGFTAVAGLDPSPRCAAACRERGFEAYVGSIGSAPAHMPKFDCVVLSHVLEHVHDIPAFFAAARHLLTPGGYLYLETPDATRYADYLYAPFQEFNTEHINHFSPLTLESTGRRFGFKSILVEQKLLQTSADTTYPAVFGLFQDSVKAGADYQVSCDRELLTKISSYIERSDAQLRNIDRNLNDALADCSSVILWGAGQLAMKLLGLPSLARVRVRALVDNNPLLRGKTFAGAPVVAPQDIAGTREPIVIATLLHDSEISAQIRRLGLGNPVITLEPSENGRA